MKFDYINRWLYYPWLKNSQMDNLIHPDDIKNIDGIGIVECLNVNNGYLVIRNRELIVRVKEEGIKRILPKPSFSWNDNIFEISKPQNIATIEDFFWHHNKEEYLYYLSFSGKKKSKQYSSNELLSQWQVLIS